MKGYNKKRKLNNKKSCGIEKNIKLYAQLYYIPFRNKKRKKPNVWKQTMGKRNKKLI